MKEFPSTNYLGRLRSLRIIELRDVTRHSPIDMHLCQAIWCHIHKITAICNYHSANLKCAQINHCPTMHNAWTEYVVFIADKNVSMLSKAILIFRM
jgi:hypothetical protein